MTKIKGGLTDAHVVATVDLDNDGDIDVISGAYTANKVSWHLNDGTAEMLFGQLMKLVLQLSQHHYFQLTLITMEILT